MSVHQPLHNHLCITMHVGLHATHTQQAQQHHEVVVYDVSSHQPETDTQCLFCITLVSPIYEDDYRVELGSATTPFKFQTAAPYDGLHEFVASELQMHGHHVTGSAGIGVATVDS